MALTSSPDWSASFLAAEASSKLLYAGRRLFVLQLQIFLLPFFPILRFKIKLL